MTSMLLPWKQHTCSCLYYSTNHANACFCHGTIEWLSVVVLLFSNVKAFLTFSPHKRALSNPLLSHTKTSGYLNLLQASQDTSWGRKSWWKGGRKVRSTVPFPCHPRPPPLLPSFMHLSSSRNPIFTKSSNECANNVGMENMATRWLNGMIHASPHIPYTVTHTVQVEFERAYISIIIEIRRKVRIVKFRSLLEDITFWIVRYILP